MAYVREELIAELGAVLLGDWLEIGSAMENHAAYLGHWIELLRENPQVLFHVLGEARRGVDLMMSEALLHCAQFDPELAEKSFGESGVGLDLDATNVWMAIRLP